MNRKLWRPASALFPLACISGAFTAGSDLVGSFFFLYICVVLLSLCAEGAFRNASAHRSTLRGLDRDFFGSILPAILGAALTGLILALLHGFNRFGIWLIIAAGLVEIVHLFVERFYALSRRIDAAVLSLIDAVFLAVGFAFDAHLPLPGMGVAAGALAGGILSAAISLAIAPSRGISLRPACLRYAPRAMVQDLLYPAAAIGAHFLLPCEGAIVGALAGMILWRGVRTVYRRSADESAPLNLAVTASASAGLILWAFLPGARCLGLYLSVAALCAIALFAHPSWRIISGGALIAAAAALLLLNPLPAFIPYIVILLCAVSISLNLRHAFLKRIR